MALESGSLRRIALLLVVAGLLWNLVEAGVAFWAGVQADSVAILAFGLDSIVELLAGGVLVWRLRTDRDEEDAEGCGEKSAKAGGPHLLPPGDIRCPPFPGPACWDGCRSLSRALRAL